jgi:hypothetical protein
MAKLSENQKRELCSLIASRMPTIHILEHFLEVHGLEVSPQQVWQYKNSEKWAEYIEESRIKYDAAVDECHFSCKRNRLDACYAAYLSAESRQDAKGMVMAVAQAQKEMEGTKVRLTDKEGEDFQFNINIGPAPEKQEPERVGPTLTLLPSRWDDEKD